MELARRRALHRRGIKFPYIYDLRLAYRLEVNHIAPREGAGYTNGCHHHLENLETLCHRCHVAVTARQRVERMERTTGQMRLVG